MNEERVIRICPLKFDLNNPDDSCEEDDCAWWVKNLHGCCAILDIAYSLDAILKREEE